MLYKLPLGALRTVARVSLSAHRVPPSPQEGLEVRQGDEVNNSLWEDMLVPQYKKQ